MTERIFRVMLLLLIFKSATSQNYSSPSPNQVPGAEAINYNGFIKNVGQVRDLKNLPVKSVLYYGQLNHKSIFITDKGLSFLFYNIKSKKAQAGSARSLKKSITDTLTHFELERVDLSLINGSILENNMETKDAPANSLYNFYFDSYSEKGTALRLKDEVLIKNVYNGIDWRIYLKQSGDSISFKYEFIVHPGAKPEDIKLHYSNNAKITLQEQELHIKSHIGFISEATPYAFTTNDKQKVEASFVNSNKNVHFQLASYDRSKTLVIDPGVYVYLCTYTGENGVTYTKKGTFALIR